MTNIPCPFICLHTFKEHKIYARVTNQNPGEAANQIVRGHSLLDSSLKRFFAKEPTFRISELVMNFNVALSAFRISYFEMNQLYQDLKDYTGVAILHSTAQQTASQQQPAFCSNSTLNDLIPVLSLTYNIYQKLQALDTLWPSVLADSQQILLYDLAAILLTLKDTIFKLASWGASMNALLAPAAFIRFDTLAIQYSLLPSEKHSDLAVSIVPATKCTHENHLPPQGCPLRAMIDNFISEQNGTSADISRALQYQHPPPQ